MLMRCSKFWPQHKLKKTNCDRLKCRRELVKPADECTLPRPLPSIAMSERWKPLQKEVVRSANKFKGPAHLKAVKSWAGLYLIQLLTRLCYSFAQFFFFFCSTTECWRTKAQNHLQNHQPFFSFFGTRRRLKHFKKHKHTHTKKAPTFASHTLPLQSHLNQVHINHCHRAAHSQSWTLGL